MKTKLKPGQLKLLEMLATCGWTAMDPGPELACARGLHRRKVPLVVLELDEEYQQKKGDIVYVARLTEQGAAVFQQNSNFILKEERDGSWMISGLRAEESTP